MEKVFNFDKAFEKAYDSFLEQTKEAEMKTLFENIAALSEETEKTLRIVEEYFEICDKAELNEAFNVDVDRLSTAILPMIAKLTSGNVGGDLGVSSKASTTYTPVGDTFNIEAAKFKDLSLTKKIVIVIKTIINWLSEFIKFILGKVKGAFLAILGRENDRKIRFMHFKEILQKNVEAAKRVEKLGGTQALPTDPKKAINVKVLNVKSDNVEQIQDIFKESVLQEATTTIISIDISKDLITLKQLMQHFFTLFDNAVGSSNEDLFGVSDLELLLDIFQASISGIHSGNLPNYELNGELVELDAIDASRVKDNLINTKLNVDALKNAYNETASKILNIGEIISHKELMMASQAGNQMFQVYSKATCAELLKIADAVKARYADAEAKLKAMEKVEKQYEQIVKELEKLSKSYLAVGSVSFTTVYQRKIANLLSSARYLTQTINLRMAGLALYIKELDDVTNCIEASINLSGGRQTESWFTKFKNTFRK